jgi:hypothetical protein
MNVLAVDWEHVKWIHLTQDRNQRQVLVNIVLNIICFIKYREFLDTRAAVNFSRGR